MTSVFIGGSRKIGRLNATIRGRLDNILSKGLHVLIGDANGGDRAVQAYLAQKGYRDVVVFCMAQGCRNNVGAWPVRVIEAHGQRGFEYYALKDAAMAQAADCGFMLWDGESRGTRSNMQRLLAASKPVVVYLAPRRQCWTLRTPLDLERLHAPGGATEDDGFTDLGRGRQAELFAPGESGAPAQAGHGMRLAGSPAADGRGSRE